MGIFTTRNSATSCSFHGRETVSDMGSPRGALGNRCWTTPCPHQLQQVRDSPPPAGHHSSTDSERDLLPLPPHKSASPLTKGRLPTSPTSVLQALQPRLKPSFW